MLTLEQKGRLAPRARFPAAVEDCYAATLWVACHLEELGAAGGRVAVAGDSAGASLIYVLHNEAMAQHR